MTPEQFDIIFDEAWKQGVAIGTLGSVCENTDQGNQYGTKEEFKNAFLKQLTN